jgi:hypothetical protein
MAAGDITRDAGSPVVTGNHWLLTGTIEVDDTHRAFALVNGTIISCLVQDADGAGSAEVDINQNAAGTSTNGSIAVNGNHVSTDTYRYELRFTM